MQKKIFTQTRACSNEHTFYVFLIIAEYLKNRTFKISYIILLTSVFWQCCEVKSSEIIKLKNKLYKVRKYSNLQDFHLPPPNQVYLVKNADGREWQVQLSAGCAGSSRHKISMIVTCPLWTLQSFSSLSVTHTHISSPNLSLLWATPMDPQIQQAGLECDMLCVTSEPYIGWIVMCSYLFGKIHTTDISVIKSPVVFQFISMSQIHKVFLLGFISSLPLVTVS